VASAQQSSIPSPRHIETCKLNGIDPQRYLEYVIDRAHRRSTESLAE
jgi:hypothetical protein